MEEEFPSLTTPFNPLFSMKIGSWQRERERDRDYRIACNIFVVVHQVEDNISCKFFFFFQIAAIIVFKIQEWSNMMATYFKDKHNQYPKPMTK